LGVLSKGL